MDTDTHAGQTASSEQPNPAAGKSGLIAILRNYPPELWMVVVALVMRLMFMSMANIVHFQELKDDLSFVNEISQIAGALASGHGYSSPFGGPSGPTAWVPPVYPAMCAVIFKFMGGYGLSAVIVILVINSLFSALTVVPLVRVAGRLFDRRIALISGWLWAVVPYFAKWAVTWLWETTLSALIMTWVFWWFLQLRDREMLEESPDDPVRRKRQLRSWLAFGLLWGFGMLTNPSVLTVIGLCFLWLLRERGFRVLKPMLLSTLVCAVVIFPWLVRNRIMLHHWIFIRSNLGYELFLGNFHGSTATCGGGFHIWLNGDEWRH